MGKEDTKKADADSLYEGRDKAFMDIDRMINEGLSGGTVHTHFDTSNIEEAHEISKELPPNKQDNKRS